MDFQSAMETFAEAWVAANAGQPTQALALTRSKSPKEEQTSPRSGPEELVRNSRDRSRSPHKFHHRPASNASSSHTVQEQMPASANSVVSNLAPVVPYFGLGATKTALTRSQTPSTQSNAITENGTASQGGPSSPPVERKDFDFSKVNYEETRVNAKSTEICVLKSQGLEIYVRPPWSLLRLIHCRRVPPCLALSLSLLDIVFLKLNTRASRLILSLLYCIMLLNFESIHLYKATWALDPTPIASDPGRPGMCVFTGLDVASDG
ncbi:hypothetical protein DMENIID0001_125200 [Sergentomyia squamirostris]